GIDRVDQGRAHRRQRRERGFVEGQREWVGRVRQRVEDVRGDKACLQQGCHQRPPPQRTAAAPAKSPACAKAAIITMSPALTRPSETARSKLIGIPAPKRLPQSSKVSQCRSAGNSSASRQFRRNTRFGWFVTSKSRYLGFTPIRSHTA